MPFARPRLRSAGEHLDRQSHHRLVPLRRAQQSRLLRGRQAPLHAVSARADLQLCIPGPLDPTPGGQAISLVDFANPDFERYPRFREALEARQVAELEPGDAIFIPSMWWHHVEALSPFNTLVNYWWSTSPKFMPTPMNALYHALWTLRDRPEREKRAWKNVFEYYVFGPAGACRRAPSRAGARRAGPDGRASRRADPRHAAQQSESLSRGATMNASGP